MLRTRDFALFVAAVLFLLVGRSVTLGTRDAATQTIAAHPSSDPGAVPQGAAITASDIDRESRVAELREKIASLGGELSAAPETVALEAPSAAEEMGEAVATTAASAAMECGPVQSVDRTIPSDIRFLEREGARLVVAPRPPTAQGSTSPTAAELAEDVVLQLPARKQPLSGSSCIETDVVGIAKDGSLIRNDEVGLYGVFGKDTLIGYALDGFPIYGMNESVETDECGGVSETGQYRYYLDDARDTILGCYSGIPVSI